MRFKGLYLPIAALVAIIEFRALARAEAPRATSADWIHILEGTGKLESAPHGAGNVYAPDVLLDAGLYRMWYGGQGRDGHDRILYAESRDGIHFERKGIAIEDLTANHVNDPSVVKVDGKYYMYFTRAGRDVVDEIALATSSDGRTWTNIGVVLKAGPPGQWDALSVGRPSVLYESDTFRMWYDGRKDLPVGAPAAANVPRSRESHRAVGYATSTDGIHWNRLDHPIFEHDAGGVDVRRTGLREPAYVMLYESHDGTCRATSDDGIRWEDHGLWIPKSGQAFDAAGHVTPFLLLLPGDAQGLHAMLYVGAAAKPTWDHNSIAARPVSLGDRGETREK